MSFEIDCSIARLYCSLYGVRACGSLPRRLGVEIEFCRPAAIASVKPVSRVKPLVAVSGQLPEVQLPRAGKVESNSNGKFSPRFG